MKRSITLLFLLSFIYSNAQQDLKQVRKKSYETLVYKISADSAEKYILQDSIPVSIYLKQQPYKVFPYKNVEDSLLETGQYILLSVEDNDIVAEVYGISNLFVYPVNNQQRVQLAVRDKSGNVITDAKIFVDNKAAVYREDAKIFEVKQSNPDESFVKVYAANDTTFLLLEGEYEVDDTPFEQRLKNFRVTRVGNIITWLPKKIGSVFKSRYSYRKPYRYKGGTGFILFNQPKYKLTDTVKFKAYILNNKKKQYNRETDVYLQYYYNNKSHVQQLASLKPSSPGAYVYSFPLSDTLINNVRYDVVFKTKKQQQLIKATFSTEDYVLDEVSKYKMRSTKDKYYKGDSIVFSASALDANGLNLLDAKAKLVLTRKAVLSVNKDSVYIPDTLFVEEKPMVTDDDTKFVVYTGNFPSANISINATLVFKNSNNELHTEQEVIEYNINSKELYTEIINDSIIAEYRENGKSVTAKGEMEIEGGFDKHTLIDFPFKAHIDPFAEDYTFYLYDKYGKTEDLEIETINERYNVSISRLSIKDSMGFVLNNPYKIPVYYSVFYGNKIVAYGSSCDVMIKWLEHAKNIHRIYKVKWQYIWGNEQYNYQESIALLYKMLDIKINTNSLVYPGQKDSIEIEVKDYKGRAASNVNLSSVAYNSQFKNSIKTPEPPYLQRYRSKNTILFDEFESDDAYVIRKYKIGDNKDAIQRFGLDSMLYYKMLFPKDGMFDAVTRILDFIPQVSVHVVKNGIPQEIYLLYLNRSLVYYNGVTDKSVYAFSSFDGYAQIAFRLKDQYVQVDSVYLQPFYKHDIVFDLDKLSANSLNKPMSDYYTNEERNLLERSIWQLDNNNKTNNGYVWQNNRVVKIVGNNQHIVGPFVTMDSLHFFSKNDFDIHFRFEPGYEYNLSKQVTRLEKKSLFPEDMKEAKLISPIITMWVLGDTIIAPPVINHNKPIDKILFLKLSSNNPLFSGYNNGAGSLQFIYPKDTTLAYVVIEDAEWIREAYVLSGNTTAIRVLSPGKYNLYLVTKNYQTAEYSLAIEDKKLLYIDSAVFEFAPNNAFINDLFISSAQPKDISSARLSETNQHNINEIVQPIIRIPKGACNIQGRILDKKGKLSVFSASVKIKGSQIGTISDINGYFYFKNIPCGTYSIEIAAIGYESTVITTSSVTDTAMYINAELKIMTQYLSEVVVVGYASQKKQSLTGSITTVSSSLFDKLNVTTLQGKTAGVLINNYAGYAGGSDNIKIRGISTLSDGASPLYIIDGIAYDAIPANISADMMGDVSVLSASEATNLYGSRASNGVIIINTKSKQLRTQFRDYAFWEPNFFTDENGRAAFEVQYPDNITGWEAYVLAIDKHKRIGKESTFIRSYKPVMAQLSLPQFLLHGDSVNAVGKNMNYTNDTYNITSKFVLNGNLKKSSSKTLSSKAAEIDYLQIIANNTDSIKAAYTLETITGFKDGEERKIPVFKRGTEETVGSFFTMPNDTSFSFTANTDAGDIEISAQNNTLDILLDELKHLKQYPYYCMEQTASKMRGLLMEKRIFQSLGKPFNDEKQLQTLIQKLQKAQLYEGGWSWWEKGNPDANITNYIIQALLPLKDDASIQPTIRNGLLYLQNQLPYYNQSLLLNSLVTLTKANHLINYKPWLNKIIFDSLSQHQQWQYVSVLQNLQMPHERELQQLIKKAIPGMLGSIHWGEDNFRWYNNANATTVLAYNVLEKEKDQQALLFSITQYFLEQKHRGFWTNTVESASITDAILPGILKINKDFNNPATINITGDTVLAINQFPYRIKTNNQNIRQLNIAKTGGGLTYMSIWQSLWNQQPKPVSNNFSIQSHFERNGRIVTAIQSGETVDMMIDITAIKEAEYVMLEIPIPAGCVYASKNQDEYGIHKEYIKNKVVMFLPALSKGEHHFTIKLEPRYTGSFTLNPVKAELMYFPVFYGRNEMKQVNIK